MTGYGGYLVKIVRDKPPGTPGIRYERIPDRETALRMLREKLVNEAVEYLADPSLVELADVVECVRALAQHDLGALGLTDVIEAAAVKRKERGGFDRLTGMYVDA